jgi:hypothetical protein
MVSTFDHALKMPYAVGVRLLSGFLTVYTEYSPRFSRSHLPITSCSYQEHTQQSR